LSKGFHTVNFLQKKVLEINKNFLKILQSQIDFEVNLTAEHFATPVNLNV